VLGYPTQSNGTDDDVLWNGTEEDGDVRSECEEDESTDCEDGDSNIDSLRQLESDMICALNLRN